MADVVIVSVLVTIGFVSVWGIGHAMRNIAAALGSRRRPAEGSRRGRSAWETGIFQREDSAAAIVRSWTRGRRCASCGGELREGRFTGHHVALLDPGGVTREWVDVAAERLSSALATSLPVCWNCHVAATFRRLHPELVTDREPGREPGREPPDYL